MRIQKEYKKIGKFWIPSKENNKVHGTLFIRDGGEIELEIVGILSKNDYIQRIVGYVEQDGSVTLDQCSFRRGSFSSGILKKVFYIERAFSGIQYKEKEESCFNSFCFSIERLHEWLGVSGITVDKTSEQGNFTIKYKQPKEISYKIKDKNIQLFFQFNNWSQSMNREKDALTAQIKEKTHINLISSKELPLTDFILIARQITNLICFAINNIVCMNDVTVTSSRIKNKNNKPIFIKLYYRSRPFTQNTDRRKSELFLHYHDGIENNMEKIINNWISLSDKTYPTFELYLSTQEAEHQFLESKFLTLIQCLEAYHQRELHKGKMQIKQRIKTIMNPFKKYIGDNEKCKKIITSIDDTRNYFIHYNPDEESKALKGQKLYALCLILEGLLQLTFLEKIGISFQRINHIATQVLRYKLRN